MKTLPLLLPLLLLLSGCNSPVNTIEPNNPNATPTIVDSRVDIFDNSLAKRLSLVSVNEAQAGDLLQIQATFRNRQVRARPFAYQFQWVRQNGMVVTSPEPVWHTATTEGGQTVSVSGTAPLPDVVDFRLSLREIR